MLQWAATWSLCFAPAGTASTPGQHRGLFTFSICSASSSSSDEIISFDVMSSGFSYLPCSPPCSLATIHWFLGCPSSCLSVLRAFALIAHSSPSSSFPLHSDPCSSLHQSGFPLVPNVSLPLTEHYGNTHMILGVCGCQCFTS